jgi:quercetin dioxygenase-like cupin family protein
LTAKVIRPKLAVVPHRVVDVIDYQAGAIVSREVVKGKTGTVTVFAFDEGQGLSEHTAPFDAFFQRVLRRCPNVNCEEAS